MKGFSALMKETPESFPVPFTMWGDGRKMATCEPGSAPSPDTQAAGASIADFQPVELRAINFSCW